MFSRHYHLAQVNVARMIAPLDSSVMAGFVAQLQAVNALADTSPGFVWRLTTPEGDATAVRAYEDPLILFNLSVWESVEALKDFTYASGHRGPLRDRAKWFEPPSQAHLALWWVPAGHIPGVEEAVERLEFRRAHGDTAVTFSFAKPHPMPDEPSADPALPAFDLDQRLFVPAANTPNGDADRGTRFHYRQCGARIWATYSGGRVRFGGLVAVADNQGRLDMRYHHVAGEALRTGAAIATTERLSDGRIRLLEEWQWTNGDRSRGSSVVEEVRS
ncbi:MAG TPA: DUF3291 domain-containing protein [Terriglobales bacterium]|nr:DUF3291 domain-containing protein [Terriglobales bacterium]